MANRVPIRYVDMPEVPAWNNIRLQSALTRLLMHERPAFIMRGPNGGGLQDNLRQHNTNALNVAYAAERLLPGVRAAIRELRIAERPDQYARGQLVSNAASLDYISPETPTTQPEIHTTLTGGGVMYVAHIGSAARRAQLAAASGPTDARHPSRTFNTAQEVDPEIVSPEVFVGSIVAGDCVVTSGSVGKYAVWQRFDTDPTLGERLQSVDQIVPTRSDYLGFDL